MLSHVDPNNKYPQVWNHYLSCCIRHFKVVSLIIGFVSFHQCLCVSPTYELALQTGTVIEQMGKYYPEVQLVYAIRGNKCKARCGSVLFGQFHPIFENLFLF